MEYVYKKSDKLSSEINGAMAAKAAAMVKYDKENEMMSHALRMANVFESLFKASQMCKYDYQTLEHIRKLLKEEYSNGMDQLDIFMSDLKKYYDEL
jgi:hypothetical protein